MPAPSLWEQSALSPLFCQGRLTARHGALALTGASEWYILW